LDIPHLLELIFSYLNDHILRYKVALVCRKWLLIQQNRFYRTITFNDFWSKKQVARFQKKLPGAGRLECKLNFDSHREIDTINIRAILGRYQRDYQRHLEQRNQIAINKQKPSLYSFNSLESINIHVGVQYEITIDSIPFPSSLTSLELSFNYSRASGENLGKIMKTCPLLEILSVEVVERARQPLDWMTLDQDLQPKPLPLQRLKLRNVNFDQDHLENLLSFAPRIKSLKLMGMSSYLGPEYDWTRLLEHLKALRITLDEVLFFEYDRQSYLDIVPRLSEICPTTWDWALWAADVTPSFLKELSLRTSFVTTLELLWFGYAAPFCCTKDLKNAPRLIHKYLCTSPQLVHLKTLKTVIRPEFMNLFNGYNLIDVDLQDQSNTLPQALWMCRGLEVLHVEVHGEHCERVLFGYFSRVLPQLEELFVHVADICKRGEDSQFMFPVGNLGLLSGLCLLSPLKYLRRLRLSSASHLYIVTENCREMDLNWMLPSGRKDKFKRQRRAELEGWKATRGEDEHREVIRRRTLPPPRIEKEADVEIWSQLRNLGLVLDVEEMVKEIDYGGFEPLPSLERLSFMQSPSEMEHPKMELKNIFK
jgi:hypothetical protein